MRDRKRIDEMPSTPRKQVEGVRLDGVDRKGELEVGLDPSWKIDNLAKLVHFLAVLAALVFSEAAAGHSARTTGGTIPIHSMPPDGIGQELLPMRAPNVT